jgi:hypothetical protein
MVHMCFVLYGTARCLVCKFGGTSSGSLLQHIAGSLLQEQLTKPILFTFPEVRGGHPCHLWKMVCANRPFLEAVGCLPM